ncbi:radical SAM protein [Candidatus Bathyarchaeota archaeon]|nr:MAG: radical SAM protein [Candidatus Bathyarchaeota archaeon]TEU05886.1 MAG: radical SAM protein [Candidatus Bathyarchaeota archaeon]
MPTWVCTECKAEYTSRCRQATCSNCGAPKEKHKKKA